VGLLGLAVLLCAAPVSSVARTAPPSTATAAKKKCKKKHRQAATAKKKGCKKKQAARPPVGTAAGPPPPPLVPQVARVQIAPQGLLLTGSGDSAQLTATPLDADGEPISGLPPPTWSSDESGTVSISSGGLASAEASSGSAQIRATIAGVSSNAVLATIAAPAAGALLITDSQVVGVPVLADPDALPSFDSLFEVTLTGIGPPAIGTLVIDTESKPIVGRVVGVEDLGGGQIRLTLHLVTAEEAFPSLDIDETIDLRGAPVEINPEITADYDVSRSGDKFSFTPKPNAAGAVAQRSGRAGTPIGTGAQLGPFSECEGETTPGSSSLPISLSAPPLFTVEFDPSLEILYSASDLEKLAIHLKPKVSVQGGIEIEAAFEGKIECKAELFVVRAPVGGPLSVLITGLIPVGVGLEAGGKLTIADAGISTKVESQGTADAGIDCPPADPDDDCDFFGALNFATPKVEPQLNAPSIGDVHFDPTLSAFGYAELAIGNVLLKKLRLDALEAKAGVEVVGSFASKTSQIADSGYSSDYKVSLDAKAGLGTELEEVAKLLGVGDITGLEVGASTDLAHSPSGTLDADHKAFLTGDHVRFTANLAQTDFFPGLGPYNVSKVLLVRNSGGTLTEVGSQAAAAGQTKFTFDFTAPDSGNVDEFYAFAVTKLIPFDLFSLELARAVGHDPITVSVTPPTVTLASGGTQQFSATVQNATNTAVTWTAGCGSITAAGLYTAPVSGGPCSVTATSQEDPSKSESATVTLAAGTIQLTGRFSDVEATDLARSACTVFQNGGDFDSFSGLGAFVGSASCTGELGSASASENSDVKAAANGQGWLTTSGTASRSALQGYAAAYTQGFFTVTGGSVQLSCHTTTTGANADGHVVAYLDTTAGGSFFFRPDTGGQQATDSTTISPGDHSLMVWIEANSGFHNASTSVNASVSCDFNGPVTSS